MADEARTPTADVILRAGAGTGVLTVEELTKIGSPNALNVIN